MTNPCPRAFIPEVPPPKSSPFVSSSPESGEGCVFCFDENPQAVSEIKMITAATERMYGLTDVTLPLTVTTPDEDPYSVRPITSDGNIYPQREYHECRT